MLFCFYYWIWTCKYRLERLSKEILYQAKKNGKSIFFFIFNLSVPLFKPSLFRVVLFFNISIYESSHRCSVTKSVLKNFANFPKKHLFLSLFLVKLQAEACNFIKKKLQHSCFPVKFAKFLKTPILKNICERLLLNLSRCYASPWNDFKETYKTEKRIFKMAKSTTRSSILNGK